MQHHFEVASHFLTATFDDDNSLAMKVTFNQAVNDDAPVDDSDENVLADRFTARRGTRLNFSGLAAIHFEMS